MAVLLLPQGRLFVYCKDNPRHKQRQGRGPRRKLHTLEAAGEECCGGSTGGALPGVSAAACHSHAAQPQLLATDPSMPARVLMGELWRQAKVWWSGLIMGGHRGGRL